MLNIIGLILLWILRIIGFILGLIIFLILIILFIPFRYDAEGSYNEKVNVKVKFSWLFRIINGKFIMDENGQNTLVKVFIFKVYPAKVKKVKPDKKKTQELKSEDKESSLVIKESKTKQKDTMTEPSTESISETMNKEVESREIGNELVEASTEASTEASVETNANFAKVEALNSNENEVNSTIDEKIKASEKKKNQKTKKSKKSKKDKKEPNKNIEQVKELWAFLQEPKNEGVLKFITKYIVKIIKWILPRKVYVDMELGLKDPALTGYIAAVTSIVYLVTKKNVHIAPNFNEQVVKGDFRIKGRLYLYQLLYYIIRVIIDKRVRRLIKKVKS